VRIVRETGASEASVQFGFVPGRPEPEFLVAQVDGKCWGRERVGKAVPLPDLSLAGTVRELELAGVSWRQAVRKGYFGEGWLWE
jgi:hypothetical protein